MVFPNEREQKLGAALVQYCSELANSDRLDEAAAESMNIAMECLQQAFGIEDVPTKEVDLLEAVCGPDDSTEKDEDETDKKNTEYCDFLWQIESKGYFKGCEVGDEEYMKRLENARQKYNQRFPDTPVPECTLSWEERQNAAVDAKKEGNELLKKEEYKDALEKYAKAIELNPGEGVFFSNRSACFLHLGDADLARQDAQRCIQRKPDWCKSYMRLGGALTKLNDLDGALKAYRNALTKVSPDEPIWQTINDQITATEQLKRPTGGNPLANMFGGGGAPGGMPGGMPGMGPGGMPDFGSMMNNPMMQQMAQKFMSDPNMMEKVQNMMQDPSMQEMARNMMGGGGMPGMPGMPGGAGGGADANFAQLMSNPAKMQEVLQKVQQDPELAEMKTTDPAAAAVLERLGTGDMTAGMELMQHPELMVKLRSLVAKHM